MNYVESIHVGENVHDVLMRLRYSTDMTNYYGYRPNKKAVDALLIIPGYVVCICSFVIVFLDDRSYDLIRMFRVKKGRIVEEVNLLSLKHNMELDILPQGSHWEGDILGQNPCGWGSLYNSDNYLLYRGCMILSSRMCYGEDYYPSVNPSLRYAGGWIENKRMGYGRFYDLHGDLLSEGNWINNSLNEASSLVITSRLALTTTLSSLVVSLVIASNTCNFTKPKNLNLSFLESLRILTVGEKCFTNVTTFSVSNLQHLTSVTIGAKSFTWKYTGTARGSSIFRVTACYSLQTLMIGAKSFSDYQTFVIEDLPSLSFLSIGNGGSGKNCFDLCPLFEVSSFPSLTEVFIGEGCFRLIHEVSFIGSL